MRNEVGSIDRPAIVRRAALAALIAFSIAGAGFAIALERELFMLVLIALVFAEALQAIADPLAGRLGGPRGLWIFVAFVVVLAIASAVVVLCLYPLLEQLRALATETPRLAERLAARVERMSRWLQGTVLAKGGPPAFQLGGFLRERVEDIVLGGGSVARSVLDGTFQALAVMFLGAFVAVAPRVHRAALLGAIPVELRPRVEAFLTRTRQGLRRWMASVLLSMGIMGLVVTGGLWLLGVPYFLVFGILAGVMELIPYVGPFAAFIGPITVCLATDPTRAVWVMVFYAVVHGLEANVLVPLLMKGRAHLPPSLVILAILFFGCIAGVLGRIAAAPALIVTLAAVEQFWLAPADLVAADGSPRAGTTETRAAA